MSDPPPVPSPELAEPVAGSWRRVGLSLRNRNFRRFLIGQGISNTGTWVQQTAELWVILQLTGSGTALGLHSVLRWGPVLVFGASAGLVGDRFDRLRLLIVTQSLHALAAAVLAVAAWRSSPTLALVYGVVLAQGLINAVDNPVRRSFLRNLASDEELSNAVSLYGTLVTVTRAFGPAIGGVLIAVIGIRWCFAINTVSYGAVLFSLVTINRGLLRPVALVQRGPRQVREGFAYAWRDPRIRQTLLLANVVSIFAWNWNILLPVYATEEFGGSSTLYGAMVSVLSVGSFLGALATARLPRVGASYVLTSGAILASSLLFTAGAPVLAVAIACLVLLGAAGSSFSVGAQARLQLNVDDQMSGRVMALWSVGFTGSKPIGGLLGGWIMDQLDARAAFAVGGVIVAVAVLASLSGSRPRRPRPSPGGRQPSQPTPHRWRSRSRSPGPSPRRHT
jgi:MFS family permease